MYTRDSDVEQPSVGVPASRFVLQFFHLLRLRITYYICTGSRSQNTSKSSPTKRKTRKQNSVIELDDSDSSFV